MPLSAFGETLRRLNAVKAVPQKELADAIGISDAMLSASIRGKRSPKPEWAHAIADALGLGSNGRIELLDSARASAMSPVQCLRNQLATKDREIAELRARLVECEESVDQAVALGEYLEGHSKGAMAERVKTALSAKFAQERKRERDEARECVGRLYSAIADAIGVLGSGNCQVCQCAGCEHERAEVKPTLRAALAATPEHLRGRATAACR